MLGWEMSPDQLALSRPDVAGLVRGLYLVGHWSRPGGGITPVMVSAMEVARRAAAQLGANSTQDLEEADQPDAELEGASV
jgi:phytoene dehydrogenase-like protein